MVCVGFGQFGKMMMKGFPVKRLVFLGLFWIELLLGCSWIWEGMKSLMRRRIGLGFLGSFLFERHLLGCLALSRSSMLIFLHRVPCGDGFGIVSNCGQFKGGFGGVNSCL